MMKILITDKLSRKGIDMLREHFDVDEKLDLSPEELIRAISGHEGIVVRSKTKVTVSVIEAGKKLKAIGRAGIGLDNIDVLAATASGISVFNAPKSTGRSVAEHAFALMFALARRIPSADRSLKDGRWAKSEFEGIELFGKTLGIVGLGNIGKIVARIGSALGMRVIAFDPHVALENGVEIMSLERLIEEADFITVHVPLVPATKGLFGEAAFRTMKPGSFLVNTSRGGIVDEKALFTALQNGEIAGAALDVFAQEPPTDSRFMSTENLITTPHIAASTREAQERMSEEIAQTLIDYLIHKTPISPVNPDALAKNIV